MLPAHVLWKKPFLQVDNLNRCKSCLFLFSLLLISLLLERASFLKYSSHFFPFYFATNFLSGEQFLEPFSVLQLSLSLSFSFVWTVLFAPPDFSFLLLSGSVCRVSPQLFLYLFFPPKQKGGTSILSTTPVTGVVLLSLCEVTWILQTRGLTVWEMN